MFFRRVFAKNNGNSSTSGEGAPSASNSANNVSCSPARYRRALNVEDNHRVLSVLQLTPLWEYIIRNNELPEGLNMNELFREFLERLHDPEYQVRQHSLRVLIDVLIVLRDESDVYFGPLLPPIIDNLGHPSPAVRKGALDVLKVYIAQTKMPETVMLEIMNYGMDRNPKDPLSTRYIVGVMLALPSLIQPAILTAKRTFILRAVINALGGKMVQITYQEIALKILLKIKNAIGSREFYECISVSYRRDFDLLCNVYGLPNPPKSPRRETVINLTPPGSELPTRKSWKPHVPLVPATETHQPMQPLSPKAQRWKSGSYNDISRAEGYDYEPKTRIRGSDGRLNVNPYAVSKLPHHGSSVVRRVSSDAITRLDDSKLIMETEIKINKEAVTMRILEADSTQSVSEESDEDNSKRYGVVRVLTDSEVDEKTIGASSIGNEPSSDDYVRQTPRRVRFGGEVVKMRTPDSDTFEQSDQDGLTISQSSSSSALNNANSQHNPSMNASSSERSSPIRSALKSSTSTDRSSTSFRRQYSQSADTERSSPPVSNEYVNTNHRPMSAKTSSYVSSEEDPYPKHVAFARRRSITYDDEDLRSSTISALALDPHATPTPTPEPPDPPEPPRERPKTSRPKSGRAPPVESAEEPSESNESSPPKEEPQTPDTQSHPEPPESNHILAEKIEEVKQAIQGIEEKINNVVLKTAEAIAELPCSPAKLVKAESADSASNSSPKLQKPNLSLEVLLDTSTDTRKNLENCDDNELEIKDYTKELNIVIPAEEKPNNDAPPSVIPKLPSGPSRIPKMVKMGVPKHSTMPSPNRLMPSPKIGGPDTSNPSSAALSPHKLTVSERGRTRRRSRSATMNTFKRSVYVSPSTLSPAPHSEIEIMHNLLSSPLASPNRNRRKSSAGNYLLKENDNNNNNLDMDNLNNGTKSDKCVNVNEDDIYDVFGKTIATQTSTEVLEDTTAPFSLMPSRAGTETDMQTCTIDVTAVDSNANRISSASLMSPSARSQRSSSPRIIEPRIINSWEDLGIVDRSVLTQLKSGDWRIRSQGFCAIEESLKSSENLAKVQPYLESLLKTLLSSERNPDIIDDKVRMLINLISRLPLENLEDRVTQILTGLCRLGGPGSNNVAKALMQRLPTAAIVQRLLSDEFLHAKSSKFRENALQMVLFALMTFPSTYFDIKTLISRTAEAAVDRKKRVRHGALDVLAVLGQISSPKLVLDVICSSIAQRPDGNHLIAAVKARLARKQLPFIGPDGTVEYALKVPSCRNSSVIMFGADVDWIEAGSGSASPTSMRSRRYPSFQVDSGGSFDEYKSHARKPSFQVYDEVKQPIESSKVSTSGWSSKIPVSHPFSENNIPSNNGSRTLYGNMQSRSYPELSEQQQQQQQQQNLRRVPQNGNGAAKMPTSNGNGNGRHGRQQPQQQQQQATISRFPEMDTRPNGRNAKNSNPYEMKPTRPSRGKLCSRMSDGFMSDTIATAQRMLQNESRPSTDPAIDNGAIRQSRNGMRFYNPNLMTSNNKQQLSTHVQKPELDLRPNLSPSKSYGGYQNHNNNGNSNNGRFFTGAEHPETPHRPRFLGENEAPGGGINQESYIIHRDEQYDSENDEKSSNDSTSTRIISNSTFNFSGKGSDPYPPPTPSIGHLPSRPQSVTSHKSIGSGILKSDGRLSRTSNIFSSNPSIKQSTDNVSIKSGRSAKIRETDTWYEREETPMRSEDVISSNQVQYESDYDEEIDEEPPALQRTITPKRYPTPSPFPLQTSYSTEELSNNNYNPIDESRGSPPKSRVQSASLGNLQQLPDEEEDEPIQPEPEKKVLKKPYLVRKSSKIVPAKELVLPAAVKNKGKVTNVIFQKTLRKFEKPKDALTNCIIHLESPNWEQNITGLQIFVRLIRHHPEMIDNQIHLLSVALARQVRNLRSQVARAACQASTEFFCTHRRCIEGEAEDIATHLLHRTADTNKFLRADATRALESMCENLSTPKVIHIITFKGATHQNAIVRTTAAKLLDKIVRQIGSDKVFTLPKESRDKLVLTGAQLLLEGSLDTRNYTKSMFKQLSEHPNYNKVLLEVIPPRTYRNIEKTLKSIRQL
ncbi:uncharacterized protein LOC129748435 [Uranotaenia lowii]|uniref:uncharacterized protein LOC129748435 n=1 Tax=Uranotaenia lowii TaxID=190385 RepID=UPI002479BE06|nr:uncharacterized protein LOC129748435 [Uranotaenia lowii]